MLQFDVVGRAPEDVRGCDHGGDASRGLRVPEGVEEAALLLGLHLEHPGLLGREGRGEFVEADGQEVLLKALDHVVDLLLLGLLYALAGEDGPAGVGVDREAAGALDEGREALAGADGVDAWVGDLAVYGHLLVELPVGHGPDEDVVVHLQRYVVHGVALHGGPEADLYPGGLGPRSVTSTRVISASSAAK